MSLHDDLRRASLTEALTDEQLDDLVPRGRVYEFSPGDQLYREGQPAENLWVLLDGQIELTRMHGRECTVYGVMTVPGQWTGGHAAWGSADAGATFLVTGNAISEGRCFVLPAEELRSFVDRWMPLGRHILDAVYQTVRRADAEARQRESLMALGKLSAGLAHEINNPASAALRSVESLRNTSDYMLQSLAVLAQRGIGGDQFLAIDGIRAELQDRSPVSESPLDAADREEAIGMWMDDRDVEHAWLMAPTFASKGADATWLESVEEAAGAENVGAALRWISSTIGTAGLLDELTEATSRVTHLVQDVKNYSQMDRASLQRADVSSGIESTLTMLSPKLRGITVERAYADDVPEIEVYGAELNQVWTNLIDNALDSMAGDGTLRLSTRLDGDDVVIEISDTGPGIPADILHRVFEPFFTTKDVGSGTGLGLDITRRIVADRHGGQIEFESEPGATTARVRLPLTR